jgi:mannose-6-phosphate isomerase-like protein (cupin superfamily)
VNPRFRRIAEEPVHQQYGDGDAQWQQATGGKTTDQGRYIEFVSRSLNGSRMNVGVDYLEPGETHLPHLHAEAEEWYYVVRGRALIRVGDDEQLCEPGTGVFIPAGAPHRVHNCGDETCEFLYGFDTGELADLTYVWLE